MSTNNYASGERLHGKNFMLTIEKLKQKIAKLQTIDLKDIDISYDNKTKRYTVIFNITDEKLRKDKYLSTHNNIVSIEKASGIATSYHRRVSSDGRGGFTITEGTAMAIINASQTSLQKRIYGILSYIFYPVTIAFKRIRNNFSSVKIKDPIFGIGKGKFEPNPKQATALKAYINKNYPQIDKNNVVVSYEAGKANSWMVHTNLDLTRLKDRSGQNKGILMDGVYYRSPEHYYQYCKAMIVFSFLNVLDQPEAKNFLNKLLKSSPLEVAKMMAVTDNPRINPGIKLGCLQNKSINDIYKKYVISFESMMYLYMLKIEYAKFNNYPQLGDSLKKTKDAVLIEASTIDSNWGIGDGNGYNRCGVALTEVRGALNGIFSSNINLALNLPSIGDLARKGKSGIMSLAQQYSAITTTFQSQTQLPQPYPQYYAPQVPQAAPVPLQQYATATASVVYPSVSSGFWITKEQADRIYEDNIVGEGIDYPDRWGCFVEDILEKACENNRTPCNDVQLIQDIDPNKRRYSPVIKLQFKTEQDAQKVGEKISAQVVNGNEIYLGADKIAFIFKDKFGLIFKDEQNSEIDFIGKLRDQLEYQDREARGGIELGM